jgi:hypothetical protein
LCSWTAASTPRFADLALPFDPVPITLADVCPPGAKGEQAAELGCLIAVDAFDAQVQPVLGELRPSGTDRKSISSGLPSTPIDTP